MKSTIIFIINFYRNYLSPMKLHSCRFYPTCSRYAIEAIEKRGLAKGSVDVIRRLLRCHPFSKGGFDPVK